MSTNTYSETDNLMERINKMREEYAVENKKWGISTKQYKIDCANSVLQKIDIDTLLNSTAIILPNTHHIYFDYTVFKTFAVPELYDRIMSWVISKLRYCVNTYGTYEIHVNLQSFSVSGFNRYRTIIEMYSNEINMNHPEFHEKMKTMHVYNIPPTMDAISKLMAPFIHPTVREKIVKYDKPSSEKALQTISEIIMRSSSMNQTNVEIENI
jgi:hypothetical protein